MLAVAPKDIRITRPMRLNVVPDEVSECFQDQSTCLWPLIRRAKFVRSWCLGSSASPARPEFSLLMVSPSPAMPECSMYAGCRQACESAPLASRGVPGVSFRIEFESSSTMLPLASEEYPVCHSALNSAASTWIGDFGTGNLLLCFVVWFVLLLF